MYNINQQGHGDNTCIVRRPLDQNQGPSFPFLSLLPFFDEYTLESTLTEINFILLVKRAILLFSSNKFTCIIYIYNQLQTIVSLTFFFFSNSGPSLALVLVRENGLGHWKQLIGPSNVEEAKEYLPEWYDSDFFMGAILISF